MRFETLPDGTQIPVLGLGTWQMGGGDSADYSRDAETISTLKQLIEMGYTHLDTAEGYAKNHCEEIVGQAIADFDRASLFITTKVSPDHFRKKDLLKSAEGSLRRLKIDYIDLYLLHWPNWSIPLSETVPALNQLVAEGKVRRIGVSNFDVAQMRETASLATVPVATNQVRYNLLHRKPVTSGVLEECRAQNMPLTAYSPIKDGVLENRVVNDIARAHGATAAQIAIAWILAQPKVITIPKTSNVGRGRENMEALDIELSDEEMQRLDAIK